MPDQKQHLAFTPLQAGLYFVATPIGAARDITLRALDVLNTADIIAAEDTRVIRHLLHIHNIGLRGRRVLACHDNNENQLSKQIVYAIKSGQSIAYTCDAGTPLISDPGYKLRQAVLDADLSVVAVPGASSVLAALTVAGLPTNQFCFLGFLPKIGHKRTKILHKISSSLETVVLYESPRRIHRLLKDLRPLCANDRQIALCRELTKAFEQTIRGSITHVMEKIQNTHVKGEIVVVLEPAQLQPTTPQEIERALQNHLQTESLRDAVTNIAHTFNQPRRSIYDIALNIKSKHRQENQ